MEHEMKVQETCFLAMKNGTKIIEPRLLDQKRKMVKVGDKIIFHNQKDLSDSIIANVVALKKFKTFTDLVDHYSIKDLYNESTTKNAYLTLLKSFYTVEEEKKFGVIAIEIKLA